MIEAYRDEVVTESIDGRNYTSTKFPTVKGLQLMGRVARVIGANGLHALVFRHAGVLRQIADQAGPESWPALLLWNINPPATFHAIEQIATAYLEDPSLPHQLLAQTKVNESIANPRGGPVAPIFDAHFRGEYPHLMRVVSFVLTHNFLGFSLGFHLTTGSRTSGETSTESSSDYETPSEESASAT